MSGDAKPLLRKLEWREFVECHPGLSDLQRRVAGRMAFYWSPVKGYADPAYMQLAHDLSASRRGIINAIEALEARGLIRVERSAGRHAHRYFPAFELMAATVQSRVHRSAGADGASPDGQRCTLEQPTVHFDPANGAVQGAPSPYSSLRTDSLRSPVLQDKNPSAPGAAASAAAARGRAHDRVEQETTTTTSYGKFVRVWSDWAKSSSTVRPSEVPAVAKAIASLEHIADEHGHHEGGLGGWASRVAQDLQLQLDQIAEAEDECALAAMH